MRELTKLERRMVDHFRSKLLRRNNLPRQLCFALPREQISTLWIAMKDLTSSQIVECLEETDVLSDDRILLYIEESDLLNWHDIDHIIGYCETIKDECQPLIDHMYALAMVHL